MEIAFYLWLGAAVVLFILELLTLSFFLLCFSVGAVVAAVCALCGLGTGVQILAFAIGSLLAFLFIRPVLIRHFNRRSASRPKTNVDALVGEEAVVLEDITPHNTGLVKVKGQNWTAVAYDKDATILKDTTVKVKAIEGVKLIVE